jgi:DNA-binding CsgD family transcriptional regulator
MSGAGSPARSLPAWRAPSAGVRRYTPPFSDELAWRLDKFNKFLLAASPVSRATAAVGREVCRTLGFSRAAFLHANFNVRRVRGGAGYGLDSSALGRISEPFESSPWIENCAASGGPAFTLNARHGPAVPMRYIELFGLGPLLCVPVIDSAGPMAAMLLDRRGEPFGVTDALLRAAASAGESLGLALEAARSYDSRSAGHGGSAGQGQVPALTVRQRQILSLLSRGLSNKEIATATGLSVFTVRDHVSSLLRCLDVGCRSAAVARGWELGLLGEVPCSPTDVGFITPPPRC